MEQIIFGGQDNALNNAADEANALMGSYAWIAAASADQRKQVCPAPGTFSNWEVELSGVPGTNPYLFTLYINGVASALTVTVAAGATTGINAGSVAVAAGDVLHIVSSRPSGNPDNTPYSRWSIKFTSTLPRQSIIMGNSACEAAGTRYGALSNSHIDASDFEADVVQPMPTNGTIKNLYAALNNSPGAAPDAYALTLRKGGADTTLTTTIVGPATSGHDTAHSIAVVTGDLVDMMMAPVDTPAADSYIYYGVVFEPTIDGESVILGGTADDLNPAAAEYELLCTGYYYDSWQAGAEPHGTQAHARGAVLKKFYVRLTGSPGAGKSYTFDITKDAGADSGIQVAIADDATTGQDLTHTWTMTDYGEVGIHCTPAGGPTVRDACWGLVSYIKPKGRGGSSTSKLLQAGVI
jgi:hypothetical protein